VASESTFRAGVRVIDERRTKLSEGSVEALVCGGDWFRHKYNVKKIKGYYFLFRYFILIFIHFYLLFLFILIALFFQAYLQQLIEDYSLCYFLEVDV
jgi:hypothetical protein